MAKFEKWIGELEVHPAARSFASLNTDEYASLLDSVKEVGIQVPILLTTDKLIVDGVHRRKAAQELDIPCPHRYLEEGDDPWKIGLELNLARRHLNESQRAMVAHRLSAESTVGRRWKVPGQEMTQSEAGKLMRISEKMVRQARRVVEDGVDELALAIDSGQVAVSDAASIVDKPKDIQLLAWKKVRGGEVKTLSQAARKVTYQQLVELTIKKGKNAKPSDKWKIHHCDVEELINHVKPGTVDLIVTDPPYNQRSFPAFSKLARFAEQALKDGGSLLVMTGHMYLQEYLNRLNSTDDLNFHWTLSYSIMDGSTRLPAARVVSSWRPIIWLVKGKYKGKTINDRIEARMEPEEAGATAYHEWGSSIGGSKALLHQFLADDDSPYGGGVVCDPMVGGGAFAIAAQELGCGEFLGGDADEKAVLITKGRLEGTP